MNQVNFTEHPQVRKAVFEILPPEGMDLRKTIARLTREQNLNEREIREELLNMLSEEVVVLTAEQVLQQPSTPPERVSA